MVREHDLILYGQRNEILWEELQKSNVSSVKPMLVESKYSPTDPESLIPGELSKKDKERLLKLLNQYKDKLLTGKVSIVQIPPHRPLLRSDAVPQYSRPYTIPESLRGAMKLELQRLTNEGIVRKAGKTLWGAPCFIIPKENKQPRLVIDYQKLNKQMIQHPFPMPRI